MWGYLILSHKWPCWHWLSSWVLFPHWCWPFVVQELCCSSGPFDDRWDLISSFAHRRYLSVFVPSSPLSVTEFPASAVLYRFLLPYCNSGLTNVPAGLPYLETFYILLIQKICTIGSVLLYLSEKLLKKSLYFVFKIALTAEWLLESYICVSTKSLKALDNVCVKLHLTGNICV